MPTLSARLGFWAAALSAATFIVYIVCFVGIAVTSPLFVWTDLSAYVAYTTGNPQFFKHLAQVAMLLFGPLFVLLLNSIHEYASPVHKVLTRAALCFGNGFAVLIGMHYFVQISVVRVSIARGALDGIEQFVQANPTSALLAINMLGWTLFLGLASLCIAPVFTGRGVAKTAKYAFLANGIFCLLGGIGFVIDSIALVFFSISLGMGAAVLVATSACAVWFRRLVRA